MIKIQLKRFFFHLLLVPAFFAAMLSSASASDDRWYPVSDQLLKSLHLDRRFHKCTAVADGDTITLEGLGTVRFIGVDTPEKNHPMLPVQFMAEEASAFTKRLCLGKRIRLEYDPFDEDKRGRYGRILAYPYLENGTLLQKQLLLKGYALCYTKYPFDERRKQRFLTWEKNATQEGCGLWRMQGMAEILWILRHEPLPIQIEDATSNAYRLRLGNWVSQPFERKELSLQLTALYQWAHALGPRDLTDQLSRSEYSPKKTHKDTPSHNITVIGMAHKKWGLIYGNHVKPRIETKMLDANVRALFKWIRDSDAQPETILPSNGYNPLPEKVMAALNPDEIAAAFLEAKPVGVGGGNLISWETAGNYIDKKVTVQGEIIRSFNSGDACFLNFHRNFTRYISIVIFKNRFERFPPHPETFYLNKTIRVKGKIKDYEGRPEMVIEDPRQIEILEKH